MESLVYPWRANMNICAHHRPKIDVEENSEKKNIVEVRTYIQYILCKTCL